MPVSFEKVHKGSTHRCRKQKSTRNVSPTFRLRGFPLKERKIFDWGPPTISLTFRSYYSTHLFGVRVMTPQRSGGISPAPSPPTTRTFRRELLSTLEPFRRWGRGGERRVEITRVVGAPPLFPAPSRRRTSPGRKLRVLNLWSVFYFRFVNGSRDPIFTRLDWDLLFVGRSGGVDDVRGLRCPWSPYPTFRESMRDEIVKSVLTDF